MAPHSISSPSEPTHFFSPPSIAAVTRNTKAPKPTAKATSKPFSRPRTSSKSKSAKGTKSTSKTSTSRAPAPTNRQGTPQVPKIPSPGTVSPDLIEETDIETHNNDERIKRLIKSVLAKKRDTQPGTSHTKTYRVHKHKSHSRRRHRRSRHYSSELSTDSEAGDRLIMSFLYHKEGTQPFLNLVSRFPTMQIKYFKQIFYRTFQPKSLTKLGQGMADRTI